MSHAHHRPDLSRGGACRPCPALAARCSGISGGAAALDRSAALLD
jgi:hypothetical protein